jgi:polar amino acid transport system substrate-binding protein
VSARIPLRPVAVALPFVLASGLVAGCTSTKSSGAGAGGSKVQLVAQGKLTVCTHLPYAPFQFKKSGKIVGFDVDMMDLVAEKLKVDQKIVDTPWEGIQSGEDLNANKCDAAAAGMTINDVRKKNLDFSAPYFDATQALIAKKGAKYSSLKDLKGKKLGVQASTTGEEYAKKQAPKDVELVQFEDVALLLTAVKSGQVAAGINDNGVLYDYVKKNPDTDVTAEFDTGEQYGFGVRKGNSALRKEINEALKKAKSDGTYNKIYKKWFGTAPEK